MVSKFEYRFLPKILTDCFCNTPRHKSVSNCCVIDVFVASLCCHFILASWSVGIDACVM